MKDVRKILSYENDEEQLGERAIEIDPVNEAKEMREIIKAIKDTMKMSNIASLSAKAIGINRRIFCIKF